MNDNKSKLENCCGNHNFEPIMNADNKTSSTYICTKCNGKVPSIVGLRYQLCGVLYFDDNK